MVPSMIQLEHDRVGRDYSLNLKAYNPGVVDGTGVFMASYLQSLTKRFALGTEVIWQKPNADIEEANMSYMAKYVGGKERDWIATATLLGGQGALQGTYWQRLSDKVEAGAEITLAPIAAPKDRKASATVAAKYDFRLASLRAQLDNTGKVSAYLEQRFTPAFSFLVTGEIDHFKVRVPVHTECDDADKSCSEHITVGYRHPARIDDHGRSRDAGAGRGAASAAGLTLMSRHFAQHVPSDRSETESQSRWIVARSTEGRTRPRSACNHTRRSLPCPWSCQLAIYQHHSHPSFESSESFQA